MYIDAATRQLTVPKNNLNRGTKTDSVTVGADAPVNTSIWPRNETYSDIQIIFGTVYGRFLVYL